MNIQKPVIFLPGALCDERVWMSTWQHLSLQERGYIPLQWAETLEQMQGLTLHAVGDRKVHLVGFSMGGYIASSFAIKYPERISSLTLIGNSSEGFSSNEIKRRKGLLRAIEKGHYHSMNRQQMQTFVHPDKLDDPKVAGVVKAMESDLGSSVLAYQTRATTPRPSLTSELNKLDCPINIIAGDRDNIVHLEHIEKMHNLIPKSKLSVIKNTGHMIPLEQPQKLAEIINSALS